MLDTIRLRLQKYEVERGAALTVQPTPYEARSGELVAPEAVLWEAGGKPVFGAKAYLNTERLNFTLLPTCAAGGALFSGVASAFVSCSLPKVLHGSNVEALDRDGAAEAFRIVEQELAEAGVHADIQQALLSRVDLFRNIAAAEPFRCYAPVFSVLAAKRKHKRDYGTTYLWSNTLREVCVYDKREELSHAGKPATGLPKNCLRFEYRMLKPRTVLEVLDCGSTVEELLHGYSGAKKAYRNAMAHELFEAAPAEVEAWSGRGLERDMVAFRERYEKQWLSRFVEAVGAVEIAKQADLETVREIVERLSGDRNKAWRFTKRLRQYKLDFESLRERPTVTLRSLYEELQEKVLAA